MARGDRFRPPELLIRDIIDYDVLWATAHETVPKTVAAACALPASGR